MARLVDGCYGNAKVCVWVSLQISADAGIKVTKEQPTNFKLSKYQVSMITLGYTHAKTLVTYCGVIGFSCQEIMSDLIGSKLTKV